MSADAILQSCQRCKHEFRVPISLKGRQLTCPYCGNVITVGQASVSASDDKLVGRDIGGCTLVKRLGAGAIGAVYEARDTTGRRVAIKMLSTAAGQNQEMVKRFKREGELTDKISHANVVGVFGSGFDKGVHYLVMEFVDGTNMATLIEERGKLPWAEACRYISQMANALASLQSLNIIHRDIKPANILISTDGQAKLADLGLGKQRVTEANANGGGEEQALTMQGAAMGSPAYMSPEQIRDASSVDSTADVYSLGATFYHLLTGQPPHAGKNATDVMQKVLKEDPPPVGSLVEDIPVGVSDLVDQMIAKDPAHRPKNAAILAQELALTMENPNRLRQRAAAGGGGSKGMLVAIIVLALLGAGAAWYFLVGPGKAPAAATAPAP